MKYYNKNTNEWYDEGTVITHRINESTVVSGIPSVAQLIEWGFEEYKEPEPTQEELLKRAKKEKISQLEEYDNSPEINSFIIDGKNMWLSVEERQQIATQISVSEAAGRESMTRWFDGLNYTFSIKSWKEMLVSLEIYAGDSLNVTERHKAIINSLNNINDVESYDFTTGYPQKIEFKLK